MSLKFLHILFIAASTILCAGFGMWSLLSPGGAEPLIRVLGILSFVCAAGLLVYGICFLRKLRHVSFL